MQGRGIVTSSPVRRLLFSLIITIIISAESYRLFESFFLRLKDRLGRIQSRSDETVTAKAA